MTQNHETDTMTIESLVKDRNAVEAHAASRVATALTYEHSDSEIHAAIRALREGGGRAEDIRSFEELLEVRGLMETDPLYWAASVSAKIEGLAAKMQQGQEVDYKEVWLLLDKAAATTLKDGGELSPFFRRLRWDDEKAVQYRRTSRLWVALPRLVRTVPRENPGSPKQIFNNGLNVLIPVSPEAAPLLEKLNLLLDRAVEGLLSYVAGRAVVDVEEVMLWFGRLFQGARMVSASQLEDRYYKEKDGRVVRKSGRGGAYLLFSCGDSHLLLADNSIGQRIHAELTRVNTLMNRFWKGELDAALCKQMLQWVANLPHEHLLRAELLLQQSARVSGLALVRRDDFRGHQDCWLSPQGLRREGVDRIRCLGSVCGGRLHPGSDGLPACAVVASPCPQGPCGLFGWSRADRPGRYPAVGIGVKLQN